MPVDTADERVMASSWRSPYERDQAIPDSVHVLCIPRQVFGKKFLFIKKPPYDPDDSRYKHEEPPPRAERKRNRKRQDKCSGVHRVAYQRVEAGRDDSLILFHLNGGSTVGVYP